MFWMFDDDLTLRIVGRGDGPASFNAEATRRGARVVWCYSIYRFHVAQIGERIETTYQEIIEQTKQNVNEFVWTSIRSVDELGCVRMAAMSQFLSDFPAGKAEGRYVEAELPSLPFADQSFDLGTIVASLVYVECAPGPGLPRSCCPRDVSNSKGGSDLPVAGTRRQAFAVGGHHRRFQSRGIGVQRFLYSDVPVTNFSVVATK